MSVVVVITQESEVYPFIRWGSRFAIALGEPLLVQIVSRTLNDADPVRIPMKEDADPLVESGRIAFLETDSNGHLFKAGFPLTLDESLPEGKREQEWRASLVLCGKPHQRRGHTLIRSFYQENSLSLLPATYFCYGRAHIAQPSR